MLPLLVSLILGAASLSTLVHSHVPLLTGYHQFAPCNNHIKWENCLDATGEVVQECGRLKVPLDWHNNTAGRASLLVACYWAVKEPKLGTLFMNPGGPGASGVDVILSGTADLLMEGSSGQYDIVSVGGTVPRASFFKDASEEAAFLDGSLLATGIEAQGNFTNQHDLDKFYSQVDVVDNLLKQFGKQCIQHSPNTFQYIGLAAAVRDMLTIHDLLEGSDKLVNYWGISYGTIIGSYFVNMFPDCIGQVVIDGVVDPVYYTNKPAYKLWETLPESTNKAFAGFCSVCAKAGPAGCAIAFDGSTAESISQWTLDLIDRAYNYHHRIGLSAEKLSAALHSQIFSAMYRPTEWAKLAKGLAKAQLFFSNASTASGSRNLEQRTPAPFTQSPIKACQTPDNNRTTPPKQDYAIFGITCADAVDAAGTTTKDVFDFLVHVTGTISPMFRPIWSDAGFYCQCWPVRAVERFAGPWNHTLANTILVVGNEADPVTPFISAKWVAEMLGKSAVLLEQDDWGHGVFAMRSNCTLAVLQNYFLHNKLLKMGKFCGTNQELFPNLDVTKQLLKGLEL